MSWYVYVLECSDDSLYTGVTNNLDNRIKVHNLGKGAKALRGRLPVSLIYQELYNTHSEALIREAEIKSWKREDKLKLIQGD